MAQEVASLLKPIEKGVVVDATYGGGGHTAVLLRELGVEIVAIDRDPTAIERAVAHRRVRFVVGNYRDLATILDGLGIDDVMAILFDFGVASTHFDDPKRGFSYRSSGPLDMRMGPDATLTAATVVNEFSENELADLIRRWGEEPAARRIATAIVAARPLATTDELALVIAAAVPAFRRRNAHPARRTFQAIRMVVNDELNAIVAGLDQAIDRLAPSGRLVAISYHSLEDRLVKRRMAAGFGKCTCPPDLPVCGCGTAAGLKPLTKGAIRPAPSEIEINRRARSAKLRAALKVAA